MTPKEKIDALETVVNLATSIISLVTAIKLLSPKKKKKRRKRK
ncbi:hypothetical protein [Schleiferilactobacillus shenzhenensis]|uniref:Uncharacterized protein n=1 Tax=Schleiferilactobacillus shenzhenensis LY-73 TaxID=1231336 RepID=U4TFT8_9LACO|nr:hypothetical protein [Schleiferilactobacillus shenzhenensis]ERL63626.1 hypothetical protein L248_2505 [Schleiferilactobacillus shenzhenensis LY-73]